RALPSLPTRRSSDLAALSELDGLMTTVSTPAEVLLCREGEPASSMNVLAAGRAKSFTVGAEGKEVIHSLLAPGDLFGAHALLGRTEHSSSLQAIIDTYCM